MIVVIANDWTEFHDWEKSSWEIHSELDIDISHTFYKLVLSYEQTGFDWVWQMLGFLSQAENKIKGNPPVEAVFSQKP